MKKKIGFTYDLKEDLPLKDGDPQDANAEFDAEETIEFVKSALLTTGHTIVPIGNIKNLLKMLPELDVDIVFNICEGVDNRNREAQVPVILEAFGIPYIGSDGLTMSLTLDKIMAKKIFSSDGIPTPRYLGIDSLAQLTDLDHMVFPMIVKMRQEGSSKGLSNASVVHNKEELDRQAGYLFRNYGAPPLIIEEFIAGSEFTVPIIGNDPPETLPIVQVEICDKLDLGEMIYTFDRISNPELKYVCPAKIDKELSDKLCDLAIRSYKAVGCLDFGRVDFRVDRNGNPHVLEINPLPSLSLEDVFDISPKVAGYDFNMAISKIIDAGLKRNGMQ
ncbi:ATP-grasp domain-containing protein [Thermoproteota archaeon]